jgi:hypothetical protein
MTKRTREIRRQNNKIRKQEEKKAWGVMLCKYGLYADLDKTWDLGVRALKDREPNVDQISAKTVIVM